MKKWFSFLACYLFTITVEIARTNDNYYYENWKFHFLPGSGMGMFLALAIPVDLPNKNLYLAYNFEANYMLPGNDTHYEYPPLIQRGVDRSLVYSAIESKLNSFGFPGRACLLRTICEASLHSLSHANGILGDIMHIIFTPSTSKKENLTQEYEIAERQAQVGNNCSVYNKNCSISVLDLISWIERAHIF